MCVIIYKPAGVELPIKDLKKAWEANNDGAGVIIPSRCPRVLKGIMKYKKLETLIDALQDHELAIHLRWATHGSVNESNTHPFPCGKDRYLMHNGILSNYGESGPKGKSDSAHFAEDLSTLRAETIKRLLETVSGKFLLVNRERVSVHGQFTEREGVYYSNLNWIPAPKVSYGTYSEYWKKSDGFTVKTVSKDLPVITKTHTNGVNTDPFHVDSIGIVSGSEISDPLAD